MKIEIFLDLDGVLVDLVAGICKHFNCDDPYSNEVNLGNYHLDKIFNMTPNEFWSPLGYDFWAKLDWMTGASAILGRLVRYVPEKQITLLTSPVATPGCVDGKLYWVRKNMPRFTRRILVGSGKEAIAAPGKLLIDDYDKNVDAWIEAGGPAIQVPRPWNRLHALPTLNYVTNELHRYFNANQELVQKS